MLEAKHFIIVALHPFLIGLSLYKGINIITLIVNYPFTTSQSPSLPLPTHYLYAFNALIFLYIPPRLR